MISVSTPVDEKTQQPNLTNLARAAEMVAEVCDPSTLVVVRSTVPLGTSRRVVLPLLDHLDRSRLTRRLPDDRRELVQRD